MFHRRFAKKKPFLGKIKFNRKRDLALVRECLGSHVFEPPQGRGWKKVAAQLIQTDLFPEHLTPRACRERLQFVFSSYMKSEQSERNLTSSETEEKYRDKDQLLEEIAMKMELDTYPHAKRLPHTPLSPYPLSSNPSRHTPLSSYPLPNTHLPSSLLSSSPPASTNTLLSDLLASKTVDSLSLQSVSLTPLPLPHNDTSSKSLSPSTKPLASKPASSPAPPSTSHHFVNQPSNHIPAISLPGFPLFSSPLYSTSFPAISFPVAPSSFHTENNNTPAQNVQVMEGLSPLEQKLLADTPSTPQGKKDKKHSTNTRLLEFLERKERNRKEERDVELALRREEMENVHTIRTAELELRKNEMLQQAEERKMWLDIIKSLLSSATSKDS